MFLLWNIKYSLLVMEKADRIIVKSKILFKIYLNIYLMRRLLSMSHINRKPLKKQKKILNGVSVLMK